MIFEWGVFGISSVCGSAMSTSPDFKPSRMRPGSTVERTYVVCF
jgi:hypothetical protein